jgi:hypothetical protein
VRGGGEIEREGEEREREGRGRAAGSGDAGDSGGATGLLHSSPGEGHHV